MSPGDLTAAVKADKALVRKRVKQLEAAGQVRTTGVTSQRLIHLAIGKAPAVAPQQNRPMKPEVEPSSSPLPIVEERDHAVLQIIKDAHRVGRTVRELAISRPEDSHGALEASVTRLRVKKLIKMDDNGRWTAS